MSTFQDLQDRIANDYLNRASYTNEIKREIQAAVRYYERRRWRFNETATSLTTSAGQSYISLPANFLVFDRLRLTYAGSTFDLSREPLDAIVNMRDNASNGLPSFFTIYGNKVELAVKPDSAYACPLYYLKSLSALSASADTNDWTNGVMQDLIVMRATKFMFANIIRSDKDAAKYQALETDALLACTYELEQFELTSLTPTSF